MTADKLGDAHDDPFGGRDELLPPDQVLGEQLPSVVVPENSLEEGRKFIFGGEVARVFEDQVIATQIPGYRQMRYRLMHVALHFLRDGTAFADLGTSTGRMLRDLIAALAVTHDKRLASVRFLGLDSEPDMLDQARSLIDTLRQDECVRNAAQQLALHGLLGNGTRLPRIDIEQHDLRTGLSDQVRDCSVITSILTLQFVPVEHRPRLLRQIHERLVPGGALLLVEKILCPSADLDDMFTAMYYADKVRAGLDTDAIIKKRRSLEGFLVPLTHRGNLELLQGAGFSAMRTDTFWRDLQFEAYVAVK